MLLMTKPLLFPFPLQPSRPLSTTTKINKTKRRYTTMSKQLNIQVISDNVCPWCYIGKKKLEVALESFPDLDYQISWHPYFLNRHGLPEEGESIKSYLERKFGVRSGGPSPLTAAGQQVGIQFSEERFIYPTLLSHRLVAFAERQEKQKELLDVLFYEYFENGANINSVDVLVSMAERAGIEGDVEGFLNSDELTDEIDAKANNARLKYRVNGVPHFIIGTGETGYSLSGAQDPETFRKVITRVLEE
eukprot:TRINITY_DN9641_c0_g1_i1.p1 TRINITY_DN9641_c0_g1~~TRINITY_DN9641_c0_g1_i1.p1  ORF type:complete len:263 (+),score=52.91 TRINITY_DN9641_c0_g1_i1:49-789(+)